MLEATRLLLPLLWPPVTSVEETMSQADWRNGCIISLESDTRLSM